MLFNSFEFAVFLPIVFAIYWLLNRTSVKLQNLFVLAASYLFYGWWDWRFLFLIFISSLADYCFGLLMEKYESKSHKKWVLYGSLAVNLGLLGFFKYYNFFIENFVEAFSFFGFTPNISSLNLILPVGISFYTFQTLSYTIDIYRGRLKPTKDFVLFATFVSFFPQLVAGPIERAQRLIPQFERKRKFSYSQSVEGLRQILWGLFKKVVVADNCAYFVDLIYEDPSAYNGSTLLLGAVFFALQVYGDFSGYSDIAIGTARLFGIKLVKNFAYPFFARDIAEFWRRWHISQTTWFRDYVGLSLGGSKGNRLIAVRNTTVIFLVSGFWHGASWNFIIWGLLNALLYIPILISRKHRRHTGIVANDRSLPNGRELFLMGMNLLVISLTFVFPRAVDVTQSFGYLSMMFSTSMFTSPFTQLSDEKLTIAFICFMFLLEWVNRRHDFALQKFGLKWPVALRYLFYYLLIFAILKYGGAPHDYYYFQF